MSVDGRLLSFKSVAKLTGVVVGRAVLPVAPQDAYPFGGRRTVDGLGDTPFSLPARDDCCKERKLGGRTVTDHREQGKRGLRRVALAHRKRSEDAAPVLIITHKVAAELSLLAS
jgi:hypothetical protein